jgi:hypothetical protein
MNKAFIAILLVFFLISSFLGNKLHQDIEKFQRYKLAYTSELNFENSLLDITGYLDSSSWNSAQERAKEARKKSIKAKQTANFYGLFTGVFILVFGLFFFLLYRKNRINYIQFGIVILSCSLVLLLIGITMPFIEIGAYMRDLNVGGVKTFNGKMYFFYQCKSVLGLISTLFQSNNLIVGIAILLFSVLNPLIKLSLYFLNLVTNSLNKQERLIKVITFIGKYSMADVYVAACFLAFLSFSNLNTGVKTESSTLLGLYFFLGYCILSIASHYFIVKKQSFLKNEGSSILDKK